MRSPGINGEGELRGQPANPGSPGKMAVKTVCVCMCVYCCSYKKSGIIFTSIKSLAVQMGFCGITTDSCLSVLDLLNVLEHCCYQYIVCLSARQHLLHPCHQPRTADIPGYQNLM